MSRNHGRLAAIVVAISLASGCAGPVQPTPSNVSPTATVGASPSGRPTDSPAPTTPRPSASPTPTARLTPSASPRPTPSPSPTPTASPTAACAQRTLDSLTEAERVGQLFLLGLADDQLGVDEQAAIETDHFGSVWFTETSQAGVAGIRSVADAVQTLAAGTAGGVHGIGFFVAANQEGGLIQALNGPGFSVIPTAVDQGKLATSTLTSDAATWGQQLTAAGIDLDFAPVTDVVPPGTASQNQPIGVLHREYGHDPATVGGHASAFLEGMASAGILTVAKHFPGLGRVVGNTDFTGGVVDTVTTRDDPYLDAFQDVIDAGVPFVMVALATYTQIDPDHLAAFSPVVIDDLLRTQLGFTGIVVSDDLGATAAVADIPPATRAIDFITAGGDMIISKTIDPAEQMALALVARAKADPTFRALVDAAALRVLELKKRDQLLSCGSG